MSAQRRVSALKDQRGGVLGSALEDVAEMPLTDSIERELKNLGRAKSVSRLVLESICRVLTLIQKTYHIREYDKTIYASSSNEESVSHMDHVGDLDGGKAWRTVRRPSDMVSSA